VGQLVPQHDVGGKLPDGKVDMKDIHLGIKLIPMISTWDQVDPTFSAPDIGR
jgi:hypothetical protein